MRTHPEDKHAYPPRSATQLLRLCCTPSRFEEVAGDLHELYLQQLRCSSRRRARWNYVREVLNICLRQVLGRCWRGLRRPWSLGALQLYPLRIYTALAIAVGVVAFVLPSDRPWAMVVQAALFVVLSFPELYIIVGGLARLLRELWRWSRKNFSSS